VSQSIHRRGAALFLTAGLTVLVLAAEPARAADLTSDTTFSLFQAGGGRIGLDGGAFSQTYLESWNATSKQLGAGITCVSFTCSGSSMTLNTTGSAAITLNASANVGVAVMDFTQGTTTNLAGAGKQYDFTTKQNYIKGASFSTSHVSATVSASASLNYTDTITAEGCSGSCAFGKFPTLMSVQANDFPVFGVDTATSTLSIGGKVIPSVPGFNYDTNFGSYRYQTPVGLDRSSKTQTQISSTSTQEIAGEAAKVLTLATWGTPAVVSGSTGDIKLKGVDLGTVLYNAGSVGLNVSENLIQTVTMTVTHAVKTFFLNAKSQPTSVPVHTAGMPAGTYSGATEVDGDVGFTLGDGVTNLAGDQIVTATTYDVALEEYLGLNITGHIIVQALSGSVSGKNFGPLFNDDALFTGDSFTLYDHVYHEYFTTYNTLTIPGVSGGVPEPAAWALMLLGFGGTGLMLRRRARTARVA